MSVFRTYLFVVVLLMVLLVFGSCTSVREAQHTVAVADSLRAAGAVFDDSLVLADAADVLGTCGNRLLRPDDYTRACYHYGRLLRRRGDQVAAMRCFISGTHAQYICRPVKNPLFSDHTTLGRIYSNMGDFCHLEGNFPLSYDIYEKSAKQFLKTGDVTAYYYALNAMALELAEQKMRDSTFTLLNIIESECADIGVIMKTWETKAILYRNLSEYDSALYAVEQLQKCGNYESTGYVIKAQSYWFLQRYDSAVYYAEQVMSHVYATAKDRYNMLYILTYNDTTIRDDDIKKRSEERADINRYVLKPQLQHLTQSIELLKQDLDKKPRYINFALLLLSLCVAGGILCYAGIKYRHRHRQMQAEAIVEQEKTARLQEEQNIISMQNAALIKENITLQQRQSEHKIKLIQEIEHNCAAIRCSHDWQKEICWKDYEHMCETINRHFYFLLDKLKAKGKLDEKEIRLCVLVLLDMFSNKQLADILCYSETGIGTFKYRVSKKLNIQSKELRVFLLSIAANGDLINVSS